MAAHSCCRAMPDLENESSPPSSFESMSDSLSEGSNKSEGMPGIENRATVKEKEEFRLAQRYDGYAPISKILKDMPDSDEERPRLDGLLWEVQETPPWSQIILLGFLHFVVLLGNIVALVTVVVPIMGGGKKEKATLAMNLLFISGINTLVHAFYGTRLPVVIGSSFTYLIPVISIADSKLGIPNPQRFEDTIREVQGSLLVASLLPIFLSLLPGLVRFIWRALDPITMIPMIIFTGFGLVNFGLPQLWSCPEIGGPSLLVVLFISQTLPFMVRRRAALLKHNKCFHWIFRINYQMLQRYGILLSIVVLWPLSAVLSVAHIYGHNPQRLGCDARRTWLVGQHYGFRIPLPFQWGSPKLDMRHACALMAASIVSMVESTASFVAASRYAGATWMPHTVLQRGLCLEGFSSVLNAMFGVSGSTVSIENVGLLGFTRVGSRKVVMVAAGFMIFFSITDVLGAFVASLPLSIIAGWSLILHGYVASVGTSFLQFCNPNSHRNMLILGVSLCMGVSIPASAREYMIFHGHGPFHAIPWVSDIVHVVLSSQATIATTVGLCLDFFIRRCRKTKYETGHRWKKRFIDPQSARRTKKYYALPPSPFSWFRPEA